MSTPGAREVDVGGAVVGEGRERVGAVACGDADDVCEFVVTRILGRRVVVGAVVAGRHDEEHVRGRCDGVVLGARVAVAAERGVDHTRSAARGVRVGGDDVRHVAAAVVAEHAQGHDGRVPSDARHPGAVVAPRSDRARDVRAVPVAVLGLRIAVDEVPAVDVVDPPVAVVIEAVRLAPGARLARVRPKVGAQVRVRRVDPGVDHGHRHLRRPGREVPRLGRADGHQPPLVGEQRVVGSGGLVHDVIGLGVEDAVHALEVRDRGADADARLGIDDLEPAYRERGVALDVRPGPHFGALRRRRIGPEAHEHARHRVRAGCRERAGLGRPRADGRTQRQPTQRSDRGPRARHPALSDDPSDREVNRAVGGRRRYSDERWIDHS